jgi:hypothetical protein
MFAYDLPSLALWATISIAIIDRRVKNQGEDRTKAYRDQWDIAKAAP